MVKCVDCENLAQLFITSVNGKPITPETLFQVTPEFLECFDFTCDCDHKRTIYRGELEHERDCADFEAIDNEDTK